MTDDQYRQLSRDAMGVREVADKLGIAPTYVKKLAGLTTLPTARKIGRDIVYWPPDVEALARFRATRERRK